MIHAIELEGLEEHVLSSTTDDDGNTSFNMTFDDNAEPLGDGEIYFNGECANVCDLADMYDIPYLNPTSASEGVLGNVDYYSWRNEDFVLRADLAGLSVEEPEYYMNFGDVYINKFTHETRPKLSSNGQAWLDQTLINLQGAMEKGLKSNPMMELDSDFHMEFAYDTHIDSYWDAGLGYLKGGDMWEIGKTPSWSHIWEGRTQTAIVTGLYLERIFSIGMAPQPEGGWTLPATPGPMELPLKE